MTECKAQPRELGGCTLDEFTASNMKSNASIPPGNEAFFHFGRFVSRIARA
jgi:hypothetical protein